MKSLLFAIGAALLLATPARAAVDAAGNITGARGVQPQNWTWKHVDTVFPQTWHHVIGWETLRDSMQALRRHEQWAALKECLLMFGVKSVDAKIGHMKGGTLTAEERDEIHDRISWPSWNIVEGPSLRDDDVHDGTALDEFTIGLTKTEAAVQAQIKQTHALMRALVAANQAAGAGNIAATAVTKMKSQCTAMQPNKGRAVIAYREAMWKPKGNKKPTATTHFTKAK